MASQLAVAAGTLFTIASLIGVVIFLARQSGVTKAVNKALEDNADAAKRILESQTHAPASSDELLDELSSDTPRKL